MDRRIEIKYDREIFQCVNRRLWWQYTSLVYQFGLAPLWIGTIVAVWFYGKGSWFEWMAVAMSVLVLLQPLISYARFMQRARRKFIDSSSPNLTYHITNDFIAIESDIGRTEILWKGLYEILKFPQGWILQFHRNLNLILPLRDIDDKIKQFIESKSQEAILARPPTPTTPPPLRPIDY